MYKVGIVGCGRIGSEFDEDPKRKYVSTHAGAYSKSAYTDLVSVCDIDKTKAGKCGKKWSVKNVYTDYKEMLKKENLDILSICTRAPVHLEIAEYAAKCGVKGIYCEKPMAYTLSSAKKMIDICNKKGIVLQINHQRRFDGLHNSLKESIERGEIGEIKQVTFYYSRGIFNTGSHMFDLLNYFFGDAEWVDAFFIDKKDVGDEDVSGIMKFKNGIFCNICCCDVNFSIFEADIIGTEGRIRLTDGGTKIDYYKVKQSPIHSENKELHECVFPCQKDTYKDEMMGGVNHLVYCIENKKKSVSSGEDGYKALMMITAFLDSAGRKEKKYLEEYSE